MAPTQYKRRRVLMESFQYRLLAFNLIYFATVLLMTAVMIFGPIMIKLNSTTISATEQQQIAGLLLSLHAWFWPGILVVFVLLAIHSVVVSHRIAGALYRFQIVFKELARGNLTVRATLRKRDYLLKEAAALNEMIEALRERAAALKEQGGHLRRVVGELESALALGEIARARELVGQASNKLRHLQGSLEQIRLDQSATASDTAANGRTAVMPNDPSRPSAVH